jgi:rhamnosyltransferase subunit B
MHVILVPLGSIGDVYPFVALGRELRVRGHRVTMIASAYFSDLAHGSGFEFAASVSSEDYLSLIGHPDFWHPLRSMHLLITRSVNPAIAVIYDLVKQYYRPGEGAVVAGTLAWGARVAQEALGLPLTTVHLQPIAIRSRHEPAAYPGLHWFRRLPVCLRSAAYGLIDTVSDHCYAGPLNAFRRKLGLPPIQGLFGQWWHSPESTLALFPSWYAPPQPDWPGQIRACGFPLYDSGKLEPPEFDVDAYFGDGEAPIVFASGSARTRCAEFFATSAAACEILGQRALFVTRFANQLPRPLPPLIRHVHYVPYSRLLPRAAVLVHHGGIGTVAQALKAGVPQLVAPCCYDQFDNAEHLRRQGVGETVLREHYTPANVAAVLRRLLDAPGVHARCIVTATQFSTGNPLIPAVAALEEYWNQPRSNGWGS